LVCIWSFGSENIKAEKWRHILNKMIFIWRKIIFHKNALTCYNINFPNTVCSESVPRQNYTHSPRTGSLCYCIHWQSYTQLSFSVMLYRKPDFCESHTIRVPITPYSDCVQQKFVKTSFVVFRWQLCNVITCLEQNLQELLINLSKNVH